MTLSYLTPPPDYRAQLMEDVRRGLTGPRRHIPSRYLYDARGSALFEEITRLPEYYLTGAETELLEEHSREITHRIRPEEIVELGSGSSRKTRLLIEAMRHTGSGERYLAIDVSEAALGEAGRLLCDDYPWLRVECLVGDLADLALLRRRGRRLIAFLGSTIGNYRPGERAALLRSVTGAMQGGDGFLLGVDLVKEEADLLAAYRDSRGVSADFNRNVLRVVNRELGGNFPVEAFDHVPTFDPDTSCVSHSLRAARPVQATIDALELEIELLPGEEIHTQLSCKFTRPQVEVELTAAGLALDSWFTDPEARFGLALAGLGS